MLKTEIHCIPDPKPQKRLRSGSGGRKQGGSGSIEPGVIILGFEGYYPVHASDPAGTRLPSRQRNPSPRPERWIWNKWLRKSWTCYYAYIIEQHLNMKKNVNKTTIDHKRWIELGFFLVMKSSTRLFCLPITWKSPIFYVCTAWWDCPRQGMLEVTRSSVYSRGLLTYCLSILGVQIDVLSLRGLRSC